MPLYQDHLDKRFAREAIRSLETEARITGSWKNEESEGKAKGSSRKDEYDSERCLYKQIFRSIA